VGLSCLEGEHRDLILETRVVASKKLQLICSLFCVMIFVGCGQLAIQDTDSLLLPNFRRSEAVDFVPGFGTTFATLSDLIAMLKP